MVLWVRQTPDTKHTTTRDGMGTKHPTGGQYGARNGGAEGKMCNMNSILFILKGTNRQHSGQMSQNIQNVKTMEIQLVRVTEVCGKYQVRKIAESL